ncbi:hypothetical protein GCM10023187_04140 [Nibrella viscosa]|uniref:YdbS-like PH domain-containing protein n=1 Tax=Nibrella viscosa TaxID=1084524 RepID=A0ABP8JUN4_9BACT
METSSNSVLLKASFNPLIRSYLLLYVAFFMLISVVGIVLLPIWLLGVGQWWSRHYFQLLECELSERSLRFKKGIIVQTEKTIPLENIQDVTFVEGPLLKYFDLCILKFETAGQSQGQAHDMQLIGIMDAQTFRNRIIEQRQRLMSTRYGQTQATNVTEQALLSEIRDSLRAIERLLAQTIEQGKPL